MHHNAEYNPVRIALEGDLTIYTVHEAWRRLSLGLAQGFGLEADLSGVAEFDSAGLQLLLLARAEAIKAGQSMRLAGLSPSVAEVFELCRLDPLFDTASAH